MTLAEFLHDLSDYYGERYPKTMAREIAKRLKTYTPRRLEALFETIIESHPRQYRQVPDVYVIQRALERTPRPGVPLLEDDSDPPVSPDEVRRVIAELAREKRAKEEHDG